MTHLDPVNGLRLSEFLSRANPRISQLIKDTNCDLNTSIRKLYDGRCICKTGYAGRICTACDHRMAWSNSASLTDCNEGHFVLITSGYPFSTGRRTEVLNLKNHKFTCPGLPDYPMEMAYGAGGMIGIVPLICGGHKGNFGSRTFYADCYTLR